MMGQKQYLHVVLSLTHTFNELERKKDRLWLPWKKNMSTSHGTLKEQLWGWNEGASLLHFFSLSYPTSLLSYTENDA